MTLLVQWLPVRVAAVVPVFLPLAALAVALTAFFGAARDSGLLLLMIVSLVTRPRWLSRENLALAIGLLAIVALKHSGNWYAAHRAPNFVVVFVSLGAAVLSRPAAVSEWLARRSTTTVAVFGVAMPAWIFLAQTNASIQSGDTRAVVPTVVQMLRHGNRDLAAWDTPDRWSRYRIGPQPYFLREFTHKPGLYSSYPAGMELFALPAAAVLVASNAACTDAEISWCDRLTARAVTVAILVMFFHLALHFSTPLAAYLTTLLLATGSAFASTTGLELWQQGGTTFWMLAVLLCEVRGGPRWLQAIACAAMLACRPSAVTFLIPFGVWVLCQDWRRGVGLTLRSMLCYAPWAVMYLRHYGTPFGPSMGFLNEPWQVGAFLPEIAFSPARGFVIYQSWCLLALLVVQPWTRWTTLCACVIALHSLLIASWPMWWGGHCYGSRLMTELVPLAGLLVLRPLQTRLEKPWGGWLIGAFLALGFAIHLPGGVGDATAWNAVPQSIDATPERLWDWRDPPFLFDWYLGK